MDYTRIFISREFNSLLGKNKRNLWICSSLLFVSVFTIAFSLGAFQVLKKRMNNPYTNWVTMPVLYQYRENIPAVKEYFSIKKNLESFQLKSISGYDKWTFKIINPKTEKAIDVIGRTLNFSDDLAGKIFEGNNVISKIDSFSINDQENLFMFFVSNDFCSETGIDPKTASGKYLRIKDFDDNSVFTFKIGAVLKDLPNHTKFIISQEFAKVFSSDNYSSSGFVDQRDGTQLSILGSKEVAKDEILMKLVDLDLIDTDASTVDLAGRGKGIVTNFYTSNFVNDSLKSIILKLVRKNDFYAHISKKWKSVTGIPESRIPMYFSFNFANLSKIRELQSFLKDNYQMEIELSVVEERDNFAMVSKLTYFMIISLILVSLVSFSIFLFNIINNHLEKIKPNIGTFMAFGFSSGDIEKIYTSSVLRLLMYSWITAGSLIFVIWGLGRITGLFDLRLLHPVVIMTFLLFNLMAYFIVKYITGRILYETPGDLIYGRV